MTPKKVKPLTGDTKSHSKFEPNVICSFGAILAWKSDNADADDDYDDDRKSDPDMSPSYTGDTKSGRMGKNIQFCEKLAEMIMLEALAITGPKKSIV